VIQIKGCSGATGVAFDLTDALQAPIYDFKVSKRVGYKPVKVPASRVVIVEGIYALSARIRSVHKPHTVNSRVCFLHSSSWTAEAVQAPELCLLALM
jgi:pantothenate kinase